MQLLVLGSALLQVQQAPGERRSVLIAYPILSDSAANRQSATSEWAADMGDGLRTKAKVKARTKAVDEAEKAGLRKLIAVIGDSANAGSIGVHSALGFTHTGTVRSCGWKFERWLDVVLMEKPLGAGDSTPPA